MSLNTKNMGFLGCGTMYIGKEEPQFL